MTKVNLNADMAEGFGAYDIGDDAAMLKIVRSANVACGFHGGDANVMDRVCAAAKAEGVSIGAHPGFNDLWGFGRRRISMALREVEAMIAYQVGALQAMAAMHGLKVTHMKPHGALNNMASEDKDLAEAIVRATKAVDPAIILLATTGSELLKAGEMLNVPTASEVFADRTYDAEGNLTSRKRDDAMIRDPEQAVEHVLRMVETGKVRSTDGVDVPVKVHSICVHGDEPTGPAVASAVRKALEAKGIEVVPLPDVPLN
ncbi:MAG: 5-oxoprolinase subunit PxpA [Nisaea sp.]|uniref:LamB/YcsF family protein n=1 Tax=Nisaea sp. TaxID=2024842 RepID=UPI001B0DF553|nr:5-oxoprolinase subunit PxpA [Nisaea sp.]MBO6563053.1 5-oxoprolinase subunit PxpA [Nisaea sp.]